MGDAASCVYYYCYYYYYYYYYYGSGDLECAHREDLGRQLELFTYFLDDG